MRTYILGLSLVLAAATAGAQSAAGVRSEWRVEIVGDAESDGRIMLELSPEIGAPIRASAQIAEGRSGDEIAANLSEAVQLAAGARYDVQVDGEDLVLTKRGGNQRDFVVAVAENTVQGVSMEVGAE